MMGARGGDWRALTASSSSEARPPERCGPPETETFPATTTCMACDGEGMQSDAISMQSACTHVHGLRWRGETWRDVVISGNQW